MTKSDDADASVKKAVANLIRDGYVGSMPSEPEAAVAALASGGTVAMSITTRGAVRLRLLDHCAGCPTCYSDSKLEDMCPEGAVVRREYDAVMNG